MAYDYTALVEAWNSEAQPPPPAEGVGIDHGAMTTEEKLDCLNGWVVHGEVPESFRVVGADLANCIDWAEFAALSEPQQANLLMLCNQQGAMIFGSAEVAHLAPGMFQAYFGEIGPATSAALETLAKGEPEPWWRYAGYGGPMSMTDIELAGLT